MRGVGVAGLIGVAAALALAAPVASAAPIEVRVARGLDGVVAAGGIDVAVVELRSGADVALDGTVSLAGRDYPVALAARGVATVTVAARLPSGASLVTALPVQVRVGGGYDEATVPAARVVARPVVVVSDAPASILAAIERWRTGLGLGEPVVLPPGGLPAAWPALYGIGALVIDRPAAELDPATMRSARRLLAAGGRVCRLVGEATEPTCALADSLSVPRTRVRASLGATTRAWAWAGLALAAALAGLLVLPRRRGAALIGVLALGALAPVVAAVRGSDSRLALRGVRADAGAGEEWIAAELGASDLAGTIELGRGLWIEPTDAEGGGPLDDVGLGGRVPGAGSWRLRGFIPAGAGGWAARLVRSPRVLPELP